MGLRIVFGVLVSWWRILALLNLIDYYYRINVQVFEVQLIRLPRWVNSQECDIYQRLLLRLRFQIFCGL